MVVVFVYTLSDLMLVYVCITIPKRVLYAIKIIIINPPFKIEQRQESFSESPQNID